MGACVSKNEKSHDFFWEVMAFFIKLRGTAIAVEKYEYVSSFTIKYHTSLCCNYLHISSARALICPIFSLLSAERILTEFSA